MQGADYKLHVDIRLWAGSAPLTPVLFEGQLYVILMNEKTLHTVLMYT